MKSQTKTNGTKPHAPAKGAPETGKPITMNSIQEYAVDLAVDLVVHGGAEDDIGLLANALLGHWYRRKFADPWHDGEYFDKQLDGFITARHDEWKMAIIAGSADNPRPNLDALSGEGTNLDNTTSGLTRAHARNDLIAEFEEFLVDGSPEEIRLLRDVLNRRDQWFGEASVSLAEAFGYEIDRQVDYIKVRPDLAKQVKAYVAALEAVPAKRKVA